MKATPVYTRGDAKFMDAVMGATWEAARRADLGLPCVCGKAKPHRPSADCFLHEMGYDLPVIEDEVGEGL